ncbi:MAG: GAF domain-containing protein [Syntrophobacteraceae bacterium]|jgi:GAF domain-containing protein|nr:GAF domain-containing protein [Syntrophobacteraceae bacterium]
MEGHARCLFAFTHVCKALNTALSLEERLKIMVQGMVVALEVKGCTIRLLDESRGTLELVASCGLSDRYFEKGAVLASKSVSDAMMGEIAYVRDAGTDPRIQYPEAVRSEGIVSILILPIRVRGKVIGVLKLHTSRERVFEQHEIEFAASLAEQGGLAIENARLLEDKSREALYLQAVTEVARAVGGTLDTEEILGLIVGRAIDVLGLKASALLLLNLATRELDLASAKGLSSEYLVKGPLSLDRSIARGMMGEVVWIEDASTDPRLQYPDRAREEGIASILSVPMTVKDQTIGALRFYTSHPREFSTLEVEFGKSLAEFGALALQNARLHQTLREDYRAAVEGSRPH